MSLIKKKKGRPEWQEKILGSEVSQKSRRISRKREQSLGSDALETLRQRGLKTYLWI